MCPSRAAARTGSRSRSTGSRKPRCRSRWRSCHPDRGPRSGEARRPAAARARGGRRARLEPERLPPARSRRRAERRGGARDGGDERLPRPPPRRPPLPRQTRPVLRRRGGPDGVARADRDRGPASRLRLRARDARARRLVRREALGAGCRMARGARVRHAAARARRAPELAVGLARTRRERARAGGVVPDLLGARAARSLVLEPVEAAAVRVAADAGDRPRGRPRARPRRDCRGWARRRRAAGAAGRGARARAAAPHAGAAARALRRGRDPPRRGRGRDRAPGRRRAGGARRPLGHARARTHGLRAAGDRSPVRHHPAASRRGRRPLRRRYRAGGCRAGVRGGGGSGARRGGLPAEPAVLSPPRAPGLDDRGGGADEQLHRGVPQPAAGPPRLTAPARALLAGGVGALRHADRLRDARRPARPAHLASGGAAAPRRQRPLLRLRPLQAAGERLMCGIYGAVSLTSAPLRHRDRLPAMAAALAHRGPDGDRVVGHERASLGARRLAILDLTTGDQPFQSPDGSVWMVCNGEIYNAPALRREYAAAGYPFRSTGDIETIVPLYERFGPEGVGRLEGMFGLAIWDDRRRVLVLARDRAGEKPLFWTRIDGELRFASEIQALLAYPDQARRLNPGAAALYAALGYVPTPHTMLAGIHQLAPAHLLVASAAGVTIHPYWDAAAVAARPSRLESPTQLRGALCAAVERELMSDVPVGVFTSGGLDSSLLAAAAARVLAGEKIHTYAVKFVEPGHDESADALAVTRHIRTTHHVA